MVDQIGLAIEVLGRVAKKCAGSLLGCMPTLKSSILSLHEAGLKVHDAEELSIHTGRKLLNPFLTLLNPFWTLLNLFVTCSHMPFSNRNSTEWYCRLQKGFQDSSGAVTQPAINLLLFMQSETLA